MGSSLNIENVWWIHAGAVSMRLAVVVFILIASVWALIWGCHRVATLLSDRRRLSALSENSRAFAEDFSEEKIAEKVLRLYRRVIVLGKSKADRSYMLLHRE